MEYLKIAQDLDMYGINYFLIRVSQRCFAVSLQSESGFERPREAFFYKFCSPEMNSSKE